MTYPTDPVSLPTDWRTYIEAIECDALDGVRPQTEIASIKGGWARVTVRFELPADTRQDDWQLRIIPAFAPTFHWAPHLSPTEEHVIDQHAFRSPALIVHDGSRMLTIVPDPDTLCAMHARGIAGDGPTSPRWYMDLDAAANMLALGMSVTEVKEHVLYVRRPGAEYASGEVRIAFYVMMTEGAEAIANPWRYALSFLWMGWGSRLFAAGQPMSGSLDGYVGHTYNWAFNSWGDAVWQQFELDGREVGAPVFIVNVTQSPNYPGRVNEREFRSIWNQAWFSSLRSAQGLYRYGRRTGNEDYMRRALMAKELALSAPQRNGFFPSVIATRMETVTIDGKEYNRSLGWETKYWGNSNRNPFTFNVQEAPFHLLDMSWTAWLMLVWHEELEPDARLVEYARTYADALIGKQDARGFFPGWLNKETLEPCGVLDDSPETSMSVTFLLKLHELTGDGRYRDSALRAMEAVASSIVAEGRWEDFETYYSCSWYGHDTLLGRRAERNGMYKQCNFSMYWTAEALLACYRATEDEAHLRLGRRVLDELLMTQASWQPPYIHVPALGGFGVMNVDGEWNDARQSLFAELIIRYGQTLGEREYVERGLAAMYASFALMYCPDNPEVKVRWEKSWPFFGEADYGFMMENYGHGGRTSADDDYMGEFTIFDWGNGAAAESYLRMKDRGLVD
ncbi:hypothetical protein [Cohnella herbarum]|uniref:Uncharacterized protein n=1 Tax=Cohnella herbarum TaxID=2728023 RepID=A0A7Z2VEV1_9BACL|nr:hypothetical protein [Cohnella herbarum]QJD81911.1 hypothetical protein HH215_01080 [Cohnella herbarum]